MDAVIVTRHKDTPVTLIIECRLEHQSSCVKGMQQFVRPEYVKVGFKSIHRQRDNGNLSLEGESKAKRGCESLFRLRPILDASPCNRMTPEST
jgi:hypothetical protein